MMYKNDEEKRKYIKSIVWIYPGLSEIQSFQHSKEQCPVVALASGR